MESLTASKAKTSFGSMLMKVQAEPVQIEKNGKPVAVLISKSDYDAMDTLKLELLRLRAAEARHENNLLDVDAVFNDLLKDR